MKSAIPAAALCALFLFSGDVNAGQSADIVAVMRGESKPIDQVTFVGKSGQLYFPDNGSWKRKHEGGIAADVVGAVRAGKNIYAVSRRAPFFRLDGEIWQHTKMANRGTATMVRSGARTLAALGKNIYALKSNKWSRLVASARSVTALWAADTTRVYFATYRGRLRRLSGTNISIIKNKLPTSDYVVQLAGKKGADLYGLSRDGTLLKIGASNAPVLSLSGELANFEIHSLGNGPTGAVLAAGTVPLSPPTATPEAGDGAPPAPGPRRSVLVELSGSGGKIIDSLWDLAPGDRFSVIYSNKGGLLVASESGHVGLKAPKAQTWVRKVVSGAAPEPGTKGHSNKGPARTR